MIHPKVFYHGLRQKKLMLQAATRGYPRINFLIVLLLTSIAVRSRHTIQDKQVRDKKTRLMWLSLLHTNRSKLMSCSPFRFDLYLKGILRCACEKKIFPLPCFFSTEVKVLPGPLIKHKLFCLVN